MGDIPFTQQGLGKLVGIEGTRIVINDPKVPGLRAELREGGTVTLYVYKWSGAEGRPIRYKLGTIPEVSVDTARTEAAKVLARIASGENPARTRRFKRGEPTLKALFDHYLEMHAKPHKKSWEEDQRIFDTDFAAWHNRKLSTISKADVTAWHTRKGKDSPYQANRCLALLRTLYNKADGLGYGGTNPAAKVKLFKEESRDRFLQPDELPRFFKAVAAEPSEKLRDFFLLALFTGQRRTNVLSMKWADVDMAQAQWRIPDTKQNKVHYVPLPEPAMEILRRRQQAEATAKRPSDYVLPGHVRGDHLKDPMKAWKNILKAAEIENLRIHDLRRTLGSYAAIGGASLAIIGGMLGHSRHETTQVYARLTNQKIAETMTGTALAIEAAGRDTSTTSNEAEQNRPSKRKATTRSRKDRPKKRQMKLQRKRRPSAANALTTELLP